MSLLHEDRSVLDGFRRGERSSLASVYRAHVSKVVDVLRMGFSFSSGGDTLRFRGFSDPLEVECFVQEVFLKAFSSKARMSYDGLRPYEPYLLAIARNVVIDELRRRRSAVDCLVGHDAEEVTELVSTELPQDEALEAGRLRALVRDFVGTRSQDERRYVSLRFEAGHSQLSAARLMGISRIRARRLERRLLKGLRDRLRSAGYEGNRLAGVSLMGLL